MKYSFALFLALCVGVIGYFSIFPDWDAQRHQAMQTESALIIASKELIRVTRKRGEIAAEADLIGEPCLVSRSESPRNKDYVFEFHRNGINPSVMSVYVDSGPTQIDYSVTSNAEYGSDGLPKLSGAVRDCGR